MRQLDLCGDVPDDPHRYFGYVCERPARESEESEMNGETKSIGWATTPTDYFQVASGQRDHLMLPSPKNPNLTVKRVYLPAGQADLPGALLVWANEHALRPQAPLFFSRKHGVDGGLKAISRVQAWTILKAASELVDVRVFGMRASHHGAVDEPAPAHPHLFRHARVREIGHTTRNLPLAQRRAGWSRLQMAYLTVGDEEARQLMQGVAD
jgi:hypothetical protein